MFLQRCLYQMKSVQQPPCGPLQGEEAFLSQMNGCSDGSTHGQNGRGLNSQIQVLARLLGEH
jgi:hypothetical protein